MKKSPGAAAVAVALALLVGPLVAGTSGAASPTTDPATAAEYGAEWLAAQVQADGSVPGGFSVAGDTGSAAIAMAAAGVGSAEFASAVGYVETNVEDFIAGGFAFDNPGRLGRLLQLIALAGDDPTSFGGTNPQQRLENSLQGNGIYGADASVQSNFNQALAVIGLVAVGRAVPASATNALAGQQCPAGSPASEAGGWGFFLRGVPADPCVAFDADSNTTGLAIQALEAVDAGGTVPAGLDYLDALQTSDGGFPYQSGNDSDPNSDALGLLAVVAAGEDPTSGRWVESGGDPYQALLAWQLGCSETDVGAFASPFSAGAADLFATSDAVVGAAGVPFPLPGPAVLAPTGQDPCAGPTTTTTTTTTSTTTTSVPTAAPAVATPASPAFTG